MSAFDVRYGYISIADIRGRLIRNPNYGGPSLSLNGWTWRPELSKAAKPEFHAALAESIQEEGIRNPILAFVLPEGIFLTFGGSRVRAAEKAGLKEIPAIINDYTATYKDYPEVTEENFKEFFLDPPKSYRFGQHGFDYHYNLERARRQNHDPSGFAWLGDEEPEWINKEFPWLMEK